MKKKLLLINPTHRDTPNASWIKYYDMPPMGLAYLAALTPDESWDISIIDENYAEVDLKATPDLVGITSLTYNINRAYELARIFRGKGAKVVLGGIHPTMRPTEAQEYVDSVVTGEADRIWGEVIRDFEQGTMKKMYHGAPASMDKLVLPRRDLFTHKIERHAMLTSRGCPLNCEFCSVTAFNGARYNRRPVDLILDEMETISSSFVTLLDDNFGGLCKRDLDGAKVILRGMIERGIRFRWGTQTVINYADDDELLELTRKSGCIVLFLGIESVNQESLTGTARKGNLVKSTNRVKEAVKRMHDHGIAVVGAFVLGNDEDDGTIFDRTIEFISDAELDACNVTISTPYPGTPLYTRIKKEGRLLYHDFPRDWKKFNFANVTYRPNKMSPEELQNGFFKVFDETTNLKTSLGRAWRTLQMSRSPFQTAACYSWNRGFHKVTQYSKNMFAIGKNKLAPEADRKARPELEVASR